MDSCVRCVRVSLRRAQKENEAAYKHREEAAVLEELVREHLTDRGCVNREKGKSYACIRSRAPALVT